MARPDKPLMPKVVREAFGHLPDGAAMQSIFTPDRAGRVADIVLGRDDLEGYIALRRFLGATIGRYANRVANGAFELDGYPGRLQANITYSISGSMELSAAFSAETDKPTIVNLTNHSFFNLAGVETGGGILDHHLTIAADTYLPVSRAGIPLGAPGRVDGTPFDFRIRHRVGVRLHDVNEQLQIRQGYDHNFCLRGGATPVPRLAARLEDPRSGRVLELLTNQPGVQFYSGNFLDGTVTGKYARVHRQYDALCLEPQAYPDTPNRPDYPSARLDPGQTYRHSSLYRFSAS